MVKVHPDHVKEAIIYTKEIWNDLFPDYAFDYSFTEDLFYEAYKNEQNQSKLARVFTFLAIILAVLGLFGLSSLLINQRTKEFGIRKVHGATALQIMWLLGRQFSTWIALALIPGLLIAYFFMEKWGQNFAYRIPPAWWIFIVAIMCAFLVAWISIGWQSVRAARKNPVESLRYE